MDMCRHCVPFLGYFRSRICLEIAGNYERLVCTKIDLSDLVTGFLFFEITTTTQLFPKLI